MKRDRTCSANGIFAWNNVMIFNEIWQKNMDNLKKATILL